MNSGFGLVVVAMATHTSACRPALDGWSMRGHHGVTPWGSVMFSRGDPELDQEVQSEIDQRSHWRRDVLVFLIGVLVLIAMLMLIGTMTPGPESSSRYDRGSSVALSRG